MKRRITDRVFAVNSLILTHGVQELPNHKLEKQQSSFYIWMGNASAAGVLTLIILMISGGRATVAQNVLYKNAFSLDEITLLDGPFKHARDLNLNVILQYDVERLLAPYQKQAGLTSKGLSYSNWDGLEGHVGGHYLSALAMNYAATKNVECKKRMEYMLGVLSDCQEVHTKNHAAWGVGYVGGVPHSKEIWSTLKAGEFKAYREAWVPWYNVHKMYAGLRDAWMYAGNDEARQMFLKFCDWGIQVTSTLTEEQMQSMLDTEHGGMNEIFADAYQISGDQKYLTAAKRFSHKAFLNPLSSGIDNLDNKHANTQVPKAVGFQRIAELSQEKKYSDAGRFFWETVTKNRSLAFGGNSRREFFPGIAASGDFVNDVEGPETCNSYNMLKLTEDLFRVHPSAQYVDYYERTAYNHILSTQHPVSGGYVYFTPARPRHYRVYSTPNEAMWCCVGSGLENHSKYNQFIYTHRSDSLFVNLFVASELQWKEKGIKVRQETNFPYEEQTSLKVTEGTSKSTWMIRYPSWVKKGALKIKVNGKNIAYNTEPSSYIAINRKWKKGDVVEIQLPMHSRIEHLPNVPNYIAILHGPILLGARTGTEDLKGLAADDSRWGHIASGERLPIDKAPIIIEDNLSELVNKLEPVSGKPLNFAASQLNTINSANLVFEPFYQIHDSRYMIYWMALTSRQYKSYLDSLGTLEKEKLALQKRTIDFVAPGEQQPEVDHAMESDQSKAGSLHNEFWRDASNGGHFSYLLSTANEKDLSLMVRYWGAEWGNRDFEIYIDNEKLVKENNTGRWNQSKFIDVVYVIPDSMIQGKKHVRVKFQSLPQNTAGAVYYVRLLKKE
jgi:uncharacterized protein